MNGWQVARYLIDAKKCIDSLLYIDNKFTDMSNLDLFEIIEGKIRHFYINLCIVFDNSFSIKEIKTLKKDDEIVNQIYYERDKNYAHKDVDYKKKAFTSRKSLIRKLKKELNYCLKVCEEKLPKCITLNYVSYDKNLFRFVNQISPLLEQELNALFYGDENFTEGKMYKVFNDTENIKNVINKEEYAVIIKNGLTLKEGLQNRQDSCIKINVLHNQDMWCTISSECKNLLEEDEKAFVDFLNKYKNEK